MPHSESLQRFAPLRAGRLPGLYRYPAWVFLHVLRVPKANIPVQYRSIRHRHVLSNSSAPFILLFAATYLIREENVV